MSKQTESKFEWETNIILIVFGNGLGNPSPNLEQGC